MNRRHLPWMVGLALTTGLAGAQQVERSDEISPVLRIERDARTDGQRGRERPPRTDTAVAPIDGVGNNVATPTMGAAHTPLTRLLPSAYGDGIASLAGADRPSPRAVSQGVNAQDDSLPNGYGLSDMFWQWGQFLDHDIDLTDGANPPESAPIPVPAGDPWFDPQGTGEVVIDFNRSIWDEASGTDADNPRQQINEISAWIDASNVYGSDKERATALRTLDGTGKLATSAGDLLPFNTAGLANAGGSSPELFLAGDVRANEQIGLTAMHTLFVREHNRIADRLSDRNPDFDGDRIYEEARRIVMAQMQVITYREFLPALVGENALPPYRGYRPDADGSIRNSFSTAAYRLGHTLLSPLLLRLDADGNEIEAGHLSLADAFFSGRRLATEGGIDPLLRGLAAQACQELDVYVIDEVRNFLFGLPGSGGFDLASLNIQRGRDHGLPDYNSARRALGLRPARRFADISSDPEVVERLARTYATPDDIDLWVGALAEDPVPGAPVGELHRAMLVDQFVALRDADRFWYERVLDGRQRREVERTTLADIIRRNTTIGDELQNDVFRVR
ncbi:MAG: peroxidase family protein [Pseudomonadota bacterium]